MKKKLSTVLFALFILVCSCTEGNNEPPYGLEPVEKQNIEKVRDYIKTQIDHYTRHNIKGADGFLHDVHRNFTISVYDIADTLSLYTEDVKKILPILSGEGLFKYKYMFVKGKEQVIFSLNGEFLPDVEERVWLYTFIYCDLPTFVEGLEGGGYILYGYEKDVLNKIAVECEITVVQLVHTLSVLETKNLIKVNNEIYNGDKFIVIVANNAQKNYVQLAYYAKGDYLYYNKVTYKFQKRNVPYGDKWY